MLSGLDGTWEENPFSTVERYPSLFVTKLSSHQSKNVFIKQYLDSFGFPFIFTRKLSGKGVASDL
jgi:hypothetical protein